MEKVLRQILEELKTLREGQEAQGQRLERVEHRLQALEQGQGNLQNQIIRLEVRLETEAFDKIGALFDGFQFHREILQRIERKLEAHDARLDSYGDEIILLRSKKKK